MLEARGVTRSFGGLLAVDDVDFDAGEEELVGLIGPNGAGKSTLLNTITGLHPPDEGRITFKGTRIDHMAPHDVARLGIGRTFQTPRTFPDATVMENVLVGAVFGTRMSPSEGRTVARRYLAFVDMDAKADVDVGSLNLLERKQLELVRGLASEPDLLLIDEIGSGLTPAELADLTDTLTAIREDLGIAIVWIEHIMDALLGTVDRVVVLDNGRKIADGPPSAVQREEAVQEAYLGGVVV